MKTCSMCHTAKDEALFARDARTKDRRTCWCRDCLNAYQRKRRAARLLLANAPAAQHSGYMRGVRTRRQSRIAELGEALDAAMFRDYEAEDRAVVDGSGIDVSGARDD